MKKESSSLKTIIADTDLETFETLKGLNDRYNIIFLSSDFAVNFILEYENIDLVLLSNRISNLNSIIERTRKKKIKILTFGKEIKYPVDYQEIEKILKEKQEEKDINIESKSYLGKKLKKMWVEGKKIFEGKEKKLIDLNEKENVSILNEANSKKDNIKVKDKRFNNSNELLEELVNDRPAGLKASSSNETTPEHRLSEPAKQAEMKIVKQKIIVLAKAKGGVGSTTIGIFLSSVLKEFSTLLIDLNFSEGGGDISYYLNIPKSPNILNFLNGYSKEALDDSVIQVRDNLHILQPPPTFDQSKKIELQDIYCITDIAKKRYHLLIIDLPNHLGDMWLGAIDLADLLILVSDLSIGSMGRLVKINNRYLYKGLEKLLILNMYGSNNDAGLNDFHIGSFFDLEEYSVIEENKILRQRTDFTKFDFLDIKDFFRLKNKVLELISN